MGAHHLIQGTQFSDDRGNLNFFNELDLKEIVRLYEIAPSSTEIVRAWQGHKDEKKWFYCNTGGFIVNLVRINNFKRPSEGLVPFRFELFANEPAVLKVEGGYAIGLKSVAEGSKLLVFSNFSLEKSKADDFRYPTAKWKAEW